MLVDTNPAPLGDSPPALDLAVAEVKTNALVASQEPASTFVVAALATGNDDVQGACSAGASATACDRAVGDCTCCGDTGASNYGLFTS